MGALSGEWMQEHSGAMSQDGSDFSYDVSGCPERDSNPHALSDSGF